MIVSYIIDGITARARPSYTRDATPGKEPKYDYRAEILRFDAHGQLMEVAFRFKLGFDNEGEITITGRVLLKAEDGDELMELMKSAEEKKAPARVRFIVPALLSPIILHIEEEMKLPITLVVAEATKPADEGERISYAI